MRSDKLLTTKEAAKLFKVAFREIGHILEEAGVSEPNSNYKAGAGEVDNERVKWGLTPRAAIKGFLNVSESKHSISAKASTWAMYLKEK